MQYLGLLIYAICDASGFPVKTFTPWDYKDPMYAAYEYGYKKCRVKEWQVKTFEILLKEVNP